MEGKEIPVKEFMVAGRDGGLEFTILVTDLGLDDKIDLLLTARLKDGTEVRHHARAVWEHKTAVYVEDGPKR